MGFRTVSENANTKKRTVGEKPGNPSTWTRKNMQTKCLKQHQKVDNFDMTSDLEWTEKISECPVYRPSVEEFHDPLTFLQKIARQASKYGICKIVSPLKASVSASDVLMKERRGFKFKTYVQRLPLVEGHKIPFSKGENNYTYQSFESMANKAFIQRFPSLRCLSPATLEKKFWHEMAHGRKETVEYGVNIEGSGFSSDPNDQLGNSKWNLKSLSHLPNSTFRLLQYQIPGITDPMLYIGMLFSIFAWHVEDHYLYSINYHHSGAAKIWYGVPGETAFDFEKVVQEHVSASSKKVDGVSESLAEKTTMFPPRILLEHNITVYRTVQMPGEFVITFPKAYHAGFSLGFNCGEAVNLAIGDWFPWGAIARENYALVGKMVIFPFEELICKEAILLFKSWRNESSEAEHFSECPIKVSFLHYICSFNKALRKLNDLGALFSYSSVSQGTIHCSFCKRDCYLGFLECNCCYLHSCLFHEVKSLDCSCLGKLIVSLREDIWVVLQVAKSFEIQQGIYTCLRVERLYSQIQQVILNNLHPEETKNSAVEKIEEKNLGLESERPKLRAAKRTSKL